MRDVCVFILVLSVCGVCVFLIFGFGGGDLIQVISDLNTHSSGENIAPWVGLAETYLMLCCAVTGVDRNQDGYTYYFHCFVFCWTKEKAVSFVTYGWPHELYLKK
jgi:hypothetical protein